MGETRTESEADDLDCELFTLSARLERFAATVRDPAVDDASRILFGLRGRVQKHMAKAALARIAPTPKGSPHDQ